MIHIVFISTLCHSYVFMTIQNIPYMTVVVAMKKNVKMHIMPRGIPSIKRAS